VNTIILVPLIALLAGIVLELLCAAWLGPRAKGWLALLSGAAALVGVALAIPAVWREGALQLQCLDWDGGVALVYRLDGLSLVFALMATGIGSAILLYCVAYMAHEAAGLTRFYVLMLTFIAGLVNLVSSANLLVAYVSWECIGLCSYFLVGFWYRQSAAARGARKVLVITHLAGYALLAGILTLFVRSGTLLWNDPALAAAFNTGIFALLLAAAMAKSVIFPLHTWIPEAMNAPTPVSALLHSACYVKAGIYLVARLYSIAPWQAEWKTAVVVLGAVTMLVGAWFALAQTDLKRLLAFSTISQLGHILTALGLGTALGASAALFYALSHGLFKGTLFLCAGAVQHATGRRDMRRLGGLARKMPATARIWLVAAASIAGVPLTNGFVAKWLLLDAALDAGLFAVVLVTWLVSILTAFYMLKATATVFYGELPADLADQPLADPAPEMRLGMGILAAGCLLFGVAPQILLAGLVQPAGAAMGFAPAVQLSLPGIYPGSAGAAVTLLAALVVGAGLFGVLRPRRGVTSGTFSGGDPWPVMGEGVGAADFTATVETALAPVYRWSDPDPLYARMWKGTQRLAGQVDRLALQLERSPLWVALVAAIALAAWVGLSVR